MDEHEQDRPRKPYQPLPQRSTASPNWRLKDDAPRVEPQTRPRNGPAQDGNRSNSNGPSDGSPGTRLYVGNLLYSAQRDDVSNFFTQNGFTVVNLSMSIDPMTGRNPSYCFVDFESANDASRAMSELNGQEVLGRPVRINPGVAKKSGDNPGLRTNSYNRGWQRQESGNAPADRYKPTFDRWSRNDAPSHWNEPQSQSKRLYVGNLPRMEPQSAVDSAMQQLFSGFELTAVSKIISPHESKKTEPGDHYYLFVDMANADDVDAAIETLDGSQTPWGGAVKVNRARENRDRKVNREQSGGFQRRPAGENRQPGEWRGRTEDVQ